MVMFYMYAMVSALQMNLSQILWCKMLSLFFKTKKPTLFIFDPPFLLTKLQTQPFLKLWNFFYPTLSKAWAPHSVSCTKYVISAELL